MAGFCEHDNELSGFIKKAGHSLTSWVTVSCSKTIVRFVTSSLTKQLLVSIVTLSDEEPNARILVSQLLDLCEFFLYTSTFQYARANIRSRCSSVSIVTRLRAGRHRGQFPAWAKTGFFFFATASRPALEPTQTPIQGVPGTKRMGRESDHSRPSSAAVNNSWSYTSTPPIRLHGVALS
jgi:hypothetical protein